MICKNSFQCFDCFHALYGSAQLPVVQICLVLFVSIDKTSGHTRVGEKGVIWGCERCGDIFGIIRKTPSGKSRIVLNYWACCQNTRKECHRDCDLDCDHEIGVWNDAYVNSELIAVLNTYVYNNISNWNNSDKSYPTSLRIQHGPTFIIADQLTQVQTSTLSWHAFFTRFTPPSGWTHIHQKFWGNCWHVPVRESVSTCFIKYVRTSDIEVHGCEGCEHTRK
jgi:hypothetical protein